MATHLHLFGIYVAIAITINTTYGNPVNLSPRSSDSLTHFTPQWPTCADNAALTGGKPLSLNVSSPVNVRPDCDNVIESICTVAAAQEQYAFYDLSKTYGTCEGHMLFSTTTLISHNDCVRNFQEITKMCMLLDSGSQNYAKPGKQFGVKNVVFNGTRGGEPGTKIWAADSAVGNSGPGYMMGPVGEFGAVFGQDPDGLGETWLL